MLPKEYQGIRILSDKEFQELHARIRRERMMDQLLQVSKEPFDLSIAKSTKRTEKKVTKKDHGIDLSKAIKDVISGKDDGATSFINWSEDFIWDRLLPPTDTEDSIESATDDNIYNYRFGQVVEDRDDDYSDLFKSEIAMVSKVLKDVNEISKQAMKQLAAYNKKGSAGPLSKTYADTLSAVIQSQKARTDAIKMISDLKAKQVDLTMKARKDNPKTEITVDDAVSQFYSSIMDGGRNEFVRNATSMDTSIPISEYGEPDDSGEPIPITDNMSQHQFSDGFDLTRPIGEYNNYSEDSDTTGYIKYEDKGVEIVVVRHRDGKLSFSAIDENDEEVDDYELPGEDLLDTLFIAPMSSYAYDKYSRKYRILDYQDSTVDISDV